MGLLEQARALKGFDDYQRKLGLFQSGSGAPPANMEDYHFRGQLHNAQRPIRDPMEGYEWARQSFQKNPVEGQANPELFGWYQRPEGYQEPAPGPSPYPPGQNYQPPPNAGMYQNAFNQGDTGVLNQNVQYPGGNEWFPFSFGGRSPYQFMPLMQSNPQAPQAPQMVAPQQRQIPLLGTPQDPYMQEIIRQQGLLGSGQMQNQGGPAIFQEHGPLG